MNEFGSASGYCKIEEKFDNYKMKLVVNELQVYFTIR